MEINKIYQGDSLEVLKTLPDCSIDCCVTSPPYYGLRDYGVSGQIGLEETPEQYVQKLIDIFREVKRVLKPEGTLWLNLGDSYATNTKGSGGPSSIQDSNAGSRYNPRKFNHGVKEKDLMGIPWMVAFALRADGWYLRQDIIWHKPNPMPESVTDRCTKSHEYIFLLSKSQRYYFDHNAIIEPYESELDRWGGEMKRNPQNEKYDIAQKANANSLARQRDMRPNKEGRNKRDVWTVNTASFSEAHFATFPEKLIVDMIKAGCPLGGTVLDPFMGSGTTGLVARKLNRNYVGIELNPKYIKIAEKRIFNEIGLFL